MLLTATVYSCNKTMKAACSILLSLRSQQDAEHTEHQRYIGRARDEVMRLRRQVKETDQQLKSEMQQAR